MIIIRAYGRGTRRGKTEMAINNTLTITGFNPNSGKPHTLRGTGPTRAAALAELEARATLTVLTPVRGTESMNMVGADYTTVAGLFKTGSDVDMILTLSKGVGYTDKVVRIDNASNTYRLAGSKGLVDIANDDIVAFAAAYTDGDGVGGYTVIAGEYVE